MVEAAGVEPNHTKSDNLLISLALRSQYLVERITVLAHLFKAIPPCMLPSEMTLILTCTVWIRGDSTTMFKSRHIEHAMATTY